MSTIRLYVLASLATEGDMHGHQLRQLAEKERVHLWTDVTVGSLYGALKRLAAEGLIEEIRTEREGHYPERSVYRITPAGRGALAELRDEHFDTVAVKPDPFDLALARLDPERIGDVEDALARRIRRLRDLLDTTVAGNERARPYLSLRESWAMDHRVHRIRAELEWHEKLLADLPAIVADERNRTPDHV